MSQTGQHTANTILSLENISRSFGGLQVLHDVNLSIPGEGIFGLIGPNGAGKTTVFNLITGLLPPSGGAIRFQGRDLARMKPHDITRLGVARTFQNIRLFKEMTLLENVLIGQHSRLRYSTASALWSGSTFRQEEARARDRALELLSWVRLEDKADTQAQHLSYGEQRKLELARALATEPKLLLLDEPVAGMNSGEKQDLMQDIQRIAARGYAMFLIEHDMPFVMGLCQDIAVLNFGRIISQGDAEHIRTDPQVIEAYLGRDDDEDELPVSADTARQDAAAPPHPDQNARMA